MKIKNTSNKIIGIGEASVLPDSVVTVPEAFENSAVLEVYRKLGFIQIIEEARKKTAAEEAAEKTAKAEKAKRMLLQRQPQSRQELPRWIL